MTTLRYLPNGRSIQFDRPTLRNGGKRKERRLTDTSKVAIKRAEYDDRRDVAQTNHAED